MIVLYPRKLHTKFKEIGAVVSEEKRLEKIVDDNNNNNEDDARPCH